MVQLIFIVLAIAGFLVHAGVSRQPRTPERLLGLLIRWSFGVAVGADAVFAFLGHTFAARQIAEQIGFPPGNPFQWEVAWANLALGVVALVAARRRDFWWPTAIFNAIFLWGAAWGHIYQLVVNGNHHPYNSGAILYTDLLVPAAVLALLLAHRRVESHRSQQSRTAAGGQPVGQQG